MNYDIIPASALIAFNLAPWPYQRPLNKDWVKHLLEIQRTYIVTFGNVIVPGSFIIINYGGTNFLADGQHRIEMLKDLSKEYDLSKIKVIRETYQCGNNSSMAQYIYYMVNDRYIVNGNISESGEVYENTANKVVDTIQNEFSKQVRASNNKNVVAPYFDPNELLRELNESGIMKTKTYEEVITIIRNYNTNYGDHLFKNNKQQYDKCIGGWYLSYLKTHCRWVRNIK
jgi:hypothetical protein